MHLSTQVSLLLTVQLIFEVFYVVPLTGIYRGFSSLFAILYLLPLGKKTKDFLAGTAPSPSL